MVRRIGWSWLVVVLANVACGQDQTKEKPILILDAGGHTAKVWKVLFTPDGKELISVSADKTIRVWDTATGEALRVLRPPIGVGYYGSLFAAALAPDGKKLAVGGFALDPDAVYLIDLPTGTLERTFRGHKSWISGLAYSPDGKRVASGSNDGTARIWNVATGASEHTLSGHTKDIYGVAFSPDSQQLATGSNDNTGRIWSVKTGASEAVLAGHGGVVGSVVWSADGTTIATGSFDQSVRLWNSDGTHRKTYGKLGGGISSVTFTSNGQQLLLTRGSIGAILDLATGIQRVPFTKHTGAILTGALSPNGVLAATGDGSQHEIYLWKTADASMTLRLASKGRSVYSAAWSKDGQAIAWGNTYQANSFKLTTPLERSFRLSDLEAGPTPDNSYRRAQPRLGGVSLEKTAAHTVSVRRDGSPTAEVKTGRQESVLCFTLLPDDRAALGSYFSLTMFDTRTGKHLRTFEGHAFEVWAVAPSPDNRYLLSGSSDQTLRIWTLDRDEPLLSLFFAGDEWIAWTPEGYYAASPGGENLMGWQVNNGRNQLGSFHAAAQFRKALYRPDVIKLLLRTGSVERALEIANEARGIKTPTTDVANVLPPRVRLTTPAQTTATRGSRLEVRARASSTGTHPVTALQLLLDGRPVEGQAGLFRVEAPKLGDVDASWTIVLTPGKHRLTVRAESAVSSGLSDEIEVQYETDQTRRPNLYVLTVGISEYTGNLKLNYAAKDAQTLAKAFQDHSKALFDKIEVKELTDQKATQREILRGITWLSKQMTQRDVGIVFLAGHGEVASNGAYYFLPTDVDLEDIAATGVPGDQIKTMLAAVPGRVVLLLDACHAGSVGKGKKRSTRPLTDDLVRDLATDERGIIVMCAATGRQFALESEEHRQGMFTQALVEGLQGKAKSVEGEVYLHHLDAYVTDRVRELSRGQQSPTSARPPSIRSFPLSRPAGPAEKSR